MQWWMQMNYDLNSKFDIEKHKERFVNYFEVIIFEDGHIEYAVPSHQEKMILIAQAKLHVSREELFKMCPRDMYSDVIIWLSEITGAISVWDNYIQFYYMNEKQLESLRKLKREGLYRGMLPNRPIDNLTYIRERFQGKGEIW